MHMQNLSAVHVIPIGSQISRNSISEAMMFEKGGLPCRCSVSSSDS